MGEMSDRFAANEIRRQELIQQTLNEAGVGDVHPSGLSKEIAQNIGIPLLALGLTGGLSLPALFMIGAGGGVQTLLNHIDPNHPVINFIASLLTGGAAGISGDPVTIESIMSNPEIKKIIDLAPEEVNKLEEKLSRIFRNVNNKSNEQVLEEAHNAIQSALPVPKSTKEIVSEELESQSFKAHLAQISEEVAKRAQNLSKEILNADTEEEAIKKLGLWQKVQNVSNSIYTGIVHATLTNLRIPLEKIITDSLFTQLQVVYKGLGTAITHSPLAGAKVMYAGWTAWAKTFPEALYMAGRSMSTGEQAFQRLLGVGDRSTYLLDKFDDSLPSKSWRWIYSFGSNAVASAHEFSLAMNYRAELRMNSIIAALDKADEIGLAGAAKIHFADRYSEYLVHNTPDTIFEKTKQNMFRNTFSDSSKMIENLTRFANNFPMIRIVAPFIKTPGALIKQGLYFTPVAPLSSAFRADIAAGGVDEASAVAKWATGIHLWSWIGHLVSMDKMTGDGPQGKGKEFWTGRHHPRSIRLGDSWYSYEHLGPFATALSMAADYAEMYKLSPEPLIRNKIQDAVEQTFKEQLEHMPFMEGVLNFSKMLMSIGKGKDKVAKEFAGRYLTEPLPAAARIGEQVYDPRERRAQDTFEELAENTPYFSKIAPLKRDIFGQPVYPPWALGDQDKPLTWPERLLNVLSPIPRYGIDNPDPVETELFNHGIDFKAVPDHISLGQGTVPIGITEQEQEQLSILSGHEIKSNGDNQYDTMSKLINSPEYNNMPPHYQREALVGAHHAYMEAGKGEILNQIRKTQPERLQVTIDPNWMVQKQQEVEGNTPAVPAINTSAPSTGTGQ